jgi:hypothetical protein
MFPMFSTPNEAIEAIETYLECINKFIKKRRKEKQIKIRIPLKDIDTTPTILTGG